MLLLKTNKGKKVINLEHMIEMEKVNNIDSFDIAIYTSVRKTILNFDTEKERDEFIEDTINLGNIK